ncbi:MAG: hypothetical protein V4515_12200 [Chloroflexota bacterium]
MTERMREALERLHDAAVSSVDMFGHDEACGTDDCYVLAALEAEARATVLTELRAEVQRLPSPTIGPTPSTGIQRWYSEGYERAARDVLALIDERPPR